MESADMEMDDEMIDRTFGAWIREQREAVGLKAEMVAEVTRIPFERLIQIESGAGKGITKKELRLLVAGYGLNPAEAHSRATWEKPAVAVLH